MLIVYNLFNDSFIVLQFSSVLACGGVYTAKQSTITHSTYPQDYLPNQDCTYTINAPTNYRIVLYFTRLELEDSTNCLNDSLKITEGSGEDLRHAVFLCGRNRFRTIRTEKGVLTVRFVTNGAIQDGGFKATYYFEYITTTPENPTTTATRTTTRTTTTIPTTKRVTTTIKTSITPIFCYFVVIVLV